MRFLRTLAALVFLPCLASALGVGHSGYVLGSNDQPLSGSHAFVFRITDAGGATVWTSNTCNLSVTAGYYATTLGESCLGPSLLTSALLPAGAVRLLELTVDTVLLSPTLALGAAPTAADSSRLAGYDLAGLEAVLDARYPTAAGTASLDPLSAQSGSLNVTGTVSASAFSGGGAALVNLSASNVTSGTLAVGRGGTGATTFTSNALLLGAGTGAVVPLASVGTAGQVLTSAGDAPPIWTMPVSSGGGGASTVNAQVGTAYTLVAGDANNAVTLSNASPVTATVPPNASVAFPVGTVVDLIQDGAGLVTVAAGTGVTLKSRDAVLTLGGQFAHATLRKTAADTWSLYGDLKNPIIMTATGGTVTTLGNFKVHTFLSSGTFLVTNNDGGGTLDYQIVAGGGGGGGYFGGGGGAGGVRSGSMVPVAFAYPVTVGDGGTGGNGSTLANGGNGGNSVFDTATALGGGGGGGLDKNGLAGGSGGGGSRHNTGGAGASGQGYAGGQGCQCDNAWDPAGGGGGQAGVGSAGSGSIAGAGGPGLTSTLSGATLLLAGGGGGGLEAGTPGTASHGGGAGGPTANSVGLAGAANTGGGGGGGFDDGISGGPGGSGIVIIKYQYKY